MFSSLLREWNRYTRKSEEPDKKLNNAVVKTEPIFNPNDWVNLESLHDTFDIVPVRGVPQKNKFMMRPRHNGIYLLVETRVDGVVMLVNIEILKQRLKGWGIDMPTHLSKDVFADSRKIVTMDIILP